MASGAKKIGEKGDDNFNVAIMVNFVSQSQNIAEKAENADYQYFLPFPQCIQRYLSQGL